MNSRLYLMMASVLALAAGGCKKESASRTLDVVAPGAEVRMMATGFEFTEGPAVNAYGNLFFTDIPNNRIYKLSPKGTISVFLENTGGANGLYFDAGGNLLACLGGRGKVVSIDHAGNVTTVVDKYKAKPFNSPNDLWLDRKGGIYFTDPRYGRRDNLPQDGEHVYYITPDRKEVIRVADDLVRPNGIIGTPDGERLYIADHGAGKTYVYTIKPDGTLSGKKLFAPEGSDGMTIDSQGNVYLTNDAVKVYNPRGRKIQTIEIPERPANVTFGGKDKRTLIVTARTSVYAVAMRTSGV